MAKVKLTPDEMKLLCCYCCGIKHRQLLFHLPWPESKLRKVRRSLLFKLNAPDRYVAVTQAFAKEVLTRFNARFILATMGIH